jgi:hypothetical protein
LVREARFELAQGCPRQPLKLVRLPFRHSRTINCTKAYQEQGYFTFISR